MIELMMTLGFSKIEASILLLLDKREYATLSEIEMNCEFHKSAISHTLSSLQQKEIVTANYSNDRGKGRPVTVWSLKDGLHKVLAEIEAREKISIHDINEKIEKLQKYVLCITK